MCCEKQRDRRSETTGTQQQPTHERTVRVWDWMGTTTKGFQVSTCARHRCTRGQRVYGVRSLMVVRGWRGVTVWTDMWLTHNPLISRHWLIHDSRCLLFPVHLQQYDMAQTAYSGSWKESNREQTAGNSGRVQLAELFQNEVPEIMPMNSVGGKTRSWKESENGKRGGCILLKGSQMMDGLESAKN